MYVWSNLVRRSGGAPERSRTEIAAVAIFHIHFVYEYIWVCVYVRVYPCICPRIDKRTKTNRGEGFDAAPEKLEDCGRSLLVTRWRSSARLPTPTTAAAQQRDFVSPAINRRILSCSRC